MKLTLFAILTTALAAVTFFAGVYVGATRGLAARDAQIHMGIEIARKVKDTFGETQPGEEIVGSIHLAKDMDLAIVKVNGVKTIKLYR